jgi:opacity protein-like surface antigen
MRSVRFLVAAGAASLLSSAAFAADMPIAPPPQYYAPPPVADFGGWYLRGDIGFSNQRVKNIAAISSTTGSVAISPASIAAIRISRALTC